MSLGLGVRQALVNDANVHLINFYNWVQAGLVVDMEFQNTSAYFYDARERFNSLITSGNHLSQESAELFYYLNRTGYNGLCRFNRSGYFNVPYGRYRKVNYVADFLEFQSAFEGWEFISGDFQGVVVRDGDVVYADPPYDVEFTAYSSSSFEWYQQVQLANWLVGLQVPVIASNQATDRIIELYKSVGFHVEIVNAPRRISSNGDRSPAAEILATVGF